MTNNLERDNLTSKHSDYAVFLPALSGFYSTYIGKQQAGQYVEQNRIPSNFENGIEGLNYLNKDAGYFHYKWSLYSAGHANLDLNKDDPKENMIRKRDRENTLVVGDSGGFQIARGVWEGNWKDPTDRLSEKRRKAVLSWLDGISDYAMTLDIPTWIIHDKVAGKKVGIDTYADCLNTTAYNNEYFIRNRNGGTKFLNVLQGSNHAEADHWYSHVKKYCDPKQYPNEHFNGWGMGGNNMGEIHLILRRLVELRHDGLLEPGVHDWMHFLGVAKLEWACVFTAIQRAIRKYHNPNFTASFDAASAFLATANGMVYHETEFPHGGNWTYRMSPGADDKKYYQDSRPWGSAMVQDGIFKRFEESPVSLRCKMNDICIYGPNDLNKINKIGKTSWDSFSYALQMGHNIWSHIYAVQEANRRYDSGVYPKMLLQELTNETTSQIIDAIFETSDKGKALSIIDHYSSFWMQHVGTRGFTGKKSVNGQTYTKLLFDIEGTVNMDKPNTAKKATSQPMFETLFSSESGN
jgi:hypothetical protein